jgi:predicted phosphodiesterase
MENRFKQIASIVFVSLVFLSCDQFEMRGFVDAYESADERFNQSMEWNSNHPFQEITVSKDDYSFFVMGDSHIGSTKNLDFFLQEAVKSKAEAVVMVGDITMGYAEDFETLKQHLPAKDVIPSFLIIGNHDLYFDGWKTYFSLFGSTTYYFSVKTPQSTDLFICLDSGSGTFGSKQLDWLKEVLESKRPLYRRCVLFSHVNLFRIRHTFSGNPFVEELRVLLELCAKNKIDMVVSGHDHKGNVVTFGNTTFVTMDLLQDDFENSGYFKLFVKNGKIEYEFVNI